MLLWQLEIYFWYLTFDLLVDKASNVHCLFPIGNRITVLVCFLHLQSADGIFGPYIQYPDSKIKSGYSFLNWHMSVSIWGKVVLKLLSTNECTVKGLMWKIFLKMSTSLYVKSILCTGERILSYSIMKINLSRNKSHWHKVLTHDINGYYAVHLFSILGLIIGK